MRNGLCLDEVSLEDVYLWAKNSGSWRLYHSGDIGTVSINPWNGWAIWRRLSGESDMTDSSLCCTHTLFAPGGAQIMGNISTSILKITGRKSYSGWRKILRIQQTTLLKLIKVKIASQLSVQGVAVFFSVYRLSVPHCRSHPSGSSFTYMRRENLVTENV